MPTHPTSFGSYYTAVAALLIVVGLRKMGTYLISSVWGTPTSSHALARTEQS